MELKADDYCFTPKQMKIFDVINGAIHIHDSFRYRPQLHPSLPIHTPFAPPSLRLHPTVRISLIPNHPLSY